MKKSIVTVISSGIVLFGVIGCGSGDSTPTPDYAKKVTVNEDIAKKTMSILRNGGMRIGVVSFSAEEERDSALTPESFGDAVLSQLGIGEPKEWGANVSVREAVMDPDINETNDCYYSGSYHKELHITRDAEDRIIGQYYLQAYTDCIHNLNLEGRSDETNETRYTFNGSRETDQSLIFGADKNTTNLQFKYNNLTFVHTRISDNVVMYDSKQDMLIEHGSERMVGKSTIKISYHGTIESKEYNNTGELVGRNKIEAKAFVFDILFEENQRSQRWNGYIFESRDLNTSHDKYLYADHFVSIFERGTIPKETYNGILGTDCFGGAVEISTTHSWDTDHSIEEIASLDPEMVPARDILGDTPFQGETILTGEESSVTIQFGLNEDNKSYGKFIFDDGTESQPMPRSDMRSEACNTVTR